MSGSLKTDSLKITLHRMDPLAQMSGKILGLFLDDSEKIDMDKPIKPNCCEKTKAVFSCPCAFFSYACKNNIEPCLEMTESLMSKDPGIIPGAEIQRFSRDDNTFGILILKPGQRPGLKLDKIKEFREDGVSIKSIGSSIKDVLLCINDVPALIGTYQKLKDIANELNRLDTLHPVAKRTYLKCFPDLLKDYAISEQPGAVAGGGSIDVLVADDSSDDRTDGIRESLLPADSGAQI